MRARAVESDDSDDGPISAANHPPAARVEKTSAAAGSRTQEASTRYSLNLPLDEIAVLGQLAAVLIPELVSTGIVAPAYFSE